jgi:multicomponent Na+:H+ antiporter subunit D
VYVLIRFHVLTGMDDLGPLILTLAGLTMVIGVAGALAQDDVKRILSFHIISQIGYMLMGLGLFTLAGVAGAIVFLVHHIPVKTVLFLVGGLIEEREGTSALDKIGGLAQRQPLLAVLFALPALSLAGIPPFSGFVAKLALVDAGIEKVAVPIVVIALANSVLTLVSMVKIWTGVFWGSGDDDAATPIRILRPGHRLMVGATAVALIASLAIAASFGPLWDLGERAAADVLDSSAYIEAVVS